MSSSSSSVSSGFDNIVLPAWMTLRPRRILNLRRLTAFDVNIDEDIQRWRTAIAKVVRGNRVVRALREALADVERRRREMARLSYSGAVLSVPGRPGVRSRRRVISSSRNRVRMTGPY